MFQLNYEPVKPGTLYAWSQTHGSQGGDLDVDEDETEESGEEEKTEGSEQ